VCIGLRWLLRYGAESLGLMPNEERRKELSRSMLEKPTGLEELMRRYQELTGVFPSHNLSPREIIDAIVERERAQSPDDSLILRPFA
jgi:hypothetical protein